MGTLFKNVFNFLIAAALTKAAVGQNAAPPVDPQGKWTGKAVCQVKDSLCKNESVVCYLSKKKEPNLYALLIKKLANGKEQSWLEVDLIYDDKYRVLMSPDVNTDTWRFMVNPDNMIGNMNRNRIYYFSINLRRSKN
jgi:hypothetical protein